LLFTEGVPDGSSPWASVGFFVAVSVVCAFAGVGVFRGRAWARFLAIGLYILAALSVSSYLPAMLIPLAFAGILVFAWRPRSGGRRVPAPEKPS